MERTPVRGTDTPNRRLIAYGLLAAGGAVAVLLFVLCFSVSFSHRPDATSSDLPEESATGSYGGDIPTLDESKGAASSGATNLPFAYEVIDVQEVVDDWGPGVTVELQTTNDVAKRATEDDLRKLWQYLAPTFGKRRVFLRLRTSVPGAWPWAMISRIKTDSEWEIDYSIHEHGIDAEPYHFVNEIDRSAPNQAYMIVTLPVLNRIQEQLLRQGWSVKSRQEDFFSAELNRGVQSCSLTLTPEGIDIDTFHATGNTFIDTVVTVFGEFGIGNEVRAKLYSVIGSPDYTRVAPAKPAKWAWKVGEMEITYTRLPNIDNLSASYASQQ